jgi:hypothetical protein
MSVTGASAAIGAAVGISATAISAITSIAFAVTGISDKINKAAASVFGEDLVKIGNIFGAAYGAFSGGFDNVFGNASPGIDVASTAGDYVNQMDAASDAFSMGGASNAGGFSLSDMAEGMGGYGDVTDLASQADAIGQMGGDVGEFNAATAPEPANVMDKLAMEDPREAANQSQQPQSLIPNTGAASEQAAGTNAAGANAAATQASATVQGPATQAPAGQRSFFDKLVFDGKGGINPTALRVGGQVLSGYAKSAQEQKMYDQKIAEERRRNSQSTGLRITR